VCKGRNTAAGILEAVKGSAVVVVVFVAASLAGLSVRIHDV
jgi:hypothetical protein